MRGNQAADYVSYISHAHSEYLINSEQCFLPDPRAVAEIQRNTTKQGKRNVISRHLHAKNDKEKIAAWRLDFVRILRIFNVRSIVSVWLLLTLNSQTELAINTHATISDTHTMVSDIHRIMAKGQERSDGINLLVSGSRTLSVTE